MHTVSYNCSNIFFSCRLATIVAYWQNSSWKIEYHGLIEPCTFQRDDHDFA